MGRKQVLPQTVCVKASGTPLIKFPFDRPKVPQCYIMIPTPLLMGNQRD